MKVLSSKEREERKEILTKAVNDALDLGNHYILIASFNGDKIATSLSELCTINEKMEVLSKQNYRAMREAMKGSKGIIIGFRR